MINHFIRKIVVAVVAIIALCISSYVSMPPFASMLLEFVSWSAIVYASIDLIMPDSKKVYKTENGQQVAVIEKVEYSIFDYKKTICLCIMFFGIIFQYALARQVKDALVIGSSAGTGGAATAKLFVLVVSIAAQFVYAYFARTMNNYRRLLYYVASFFTLFFVGFALICTNKGVGPILNQALIPHISTVKRIFGWLPGGLEGGLFKLVAGVATNWLSVVFYIFAEILGSILLTSFFWQVNSKYVDRKVIIGNNRMILVMGQIAQLGSGFAGGYIGTILKTTSPFKAINLFTICMIIGTIFVFVGNYFLFDTIDQQIASGYVMSETPVKTATSSTTTQPVKGMWEVLKEKPIIALVASLSILQAVPVTFLENVWKSTAKKYVSAGCIDEKSVSGAYQTYVAENMRMQARFSIVFSLIAPHIFSSIMGWTGFALATPLVTLAGIIVIFGMPLYEHFTAVQISLKFKTYVGGAMLIVVRALKYMFFDATRERYIKSLPEQEAREAKNTEGTIARFGKGASSAIISTLNACNIQEATVPYLIILAACSLIDTSVWTAAITMIAPTMINVSM